MWSWLGTVERAIKWPLGDLGFTTSVTPQVSYSLLSELQFPHLWTETIISKVLLDLTLFDCRILYFKKGERKIIFIYCYKNKMI